MDRLTPEDVYCGFWEAAHYYVAPQRLLDGPPVICVAAIDAERFRESDGEKGTRDNCRIAIARSATPEAFLFRYDDENVTVGAKQRYMQD